MSNRRHFPLTVRTAKGKLLSSAADTNGAKERQKDMARIFSAMHPLSPVNVNLRESLFCGARLYGYCECGECLRKCHPQPNEAHTHKIEKLRDCLVRGCNFCAGVCSGICVGEMRRGMLIVPCGGAEKFLLKEIAEAAVMRA